MVQNKEVREVFEEALAIGAANTKEKRRHATTNERLMVRAAQNVYAAHLIEAVRADGFTPEVGGAAGRAEVEEAAREGRALTARAYAMLIGYSEAYISRLYRLGFGLAAGVLDPNAKPDGTGPTRWQLVSRQIGDSPEVGKVLGKDVDVLPTVEALDAAIKKAIDRRDKERQERATAEIEAGPTWIPSKPSEQIAMLEELADVVHDGHRLSPRQIERVAKVMDNLRSLVEEWASAEGGQSIPRQRAS